MSQTEARPLSTAVLAAYGAGWIGGPVFRDVPALALLPFMTTAIGVPPAVAGAAIFLPKLWVVVCDPLMGLWSDRTVSRWGRRRPFLFWGAILCGITMVMLFHVPDLASGIARGVYVGAVYLIASTAFSIYSVPYLTFASELSADTHQNTVVMHWRQMGLGLGLIAGNAMPLWLVSQGGGGAPGFGFMAWVLGAICFVTMFATFAGTATVPITTPAAAASVPLRAQLRLAAGNRPFLVLVAANFVQLVGSACGYATTAMYFIYYLDKSIAFLSTFLLIMSVTAVLVPPVWTRVSRRIGKRNVYHLACAGFALTYLSLLPARGEPDATILARAVLVAVFNGGFSLMAFSMMLDCIAADRLHSGLNREGVFSGLWSAMDKVAFACGALLAGALLGWFGFVESTEGFVAQSSRAVEGIALILSGAVAAGTTLAALIMTRYPAERGAPRLG
jgi:GPH family glycoside/pentoside/hexuronide:cation symporter